MITGVGQATQGPQNYFVCLAPKVSGRQGVTKFVHDNRDQKDHDSGKIVFERDRVVVFEKIQDRQQNKAPVRFEWDALEGEEVDTGVEVAHELILHFLGARTQHKGLILLLLPLQGHSGPNRSPGPIAACQEEQSPG